MIPILDAKDHFLVVLKRPVTTGDGREFHKVWGATCYHDEANRTFIKVGGFGNEMLIDPNNLDYVICEATAPTDEKVLVLGDEYNDLNPLSTSNNQK